MDHHQLLIQSVSQNKAPAQVTNPSGTISADCDLILLGFSKLLASFFYDCENVFNFEKIYLLILFIPQNGDEQDHFSHYVMRTLVYPYEIIT